MCYGDCSFSRYTHGGVLFSISCVIYHTFCNIATSFRESQWGFMIVVKANKLANFLQHSVIRDASIGRLSFGETISRIIVHLESLNVWVSFVICLWTNKDIWMRYVDDYEMDLWLKRELLLRRNYFACVAHRLLHFTPKKCWEREIN